MFQIFFGRLSETFTLGSFVLFVFDHPQVSTLYYSCQLSWDRRSQQSGWFLQPLGSGRQSLRYPSDHVRFHLVGVEINRFSPRLRELKADSQSLVSSDAANMRRMRYDPYRRLNVWSCISRLDSRNRSSSLSFWSRSLETMSFRIIAIWLPGFKRSTRAFNQLAAK